MLAPVQPVSGAQPAIQGSQSGAYPATATTPAYGDPLAPAPQTQEGYPTTGAATYDDDEAWGAPVKQGPDQ